MKNSFLHHLLYIFTACVLISTTDSNINFTDIPLTSGGLNANTDVLNSMALPNLASFTAQTLNGNFNQVTGIYSTGHFALPVVQQPAENAAYIATSPDTATQFSLANQYGSLGFLAHNNLAGSLFFNLTQGSIVTVIYGDGHYRYFIVDEIRHFQAVSPNNPYSNFIDLEQGNSLSVSDLFYQTYGVAGQAVFQTCINKNGVDSWGRLFVIAHPYIMITQSRRLTLTPM